LQGTGKLDSRAGWGGTGKRLARRQTNIEKKERGVPEEARKDTKLMFGY